MSKKDLMTTAWDDLLEDLECGSEELFELLEKTIVREELRTSLRYLRERKKGVEA